MRIIYKNEYVDFEAPIFMGKEQREKFIVFMKELFLNRVTTIDTAEKKKFIGDRDTVQKKWTVDDLFLLLGTDDNHTISSNTGRTEMSVIMKRGDFVPQFMVWAKKKRYAIVQDKKIIKEFLNERK